VITGNHLRHSLYDDIQNMAFLSRNSLLNYWLPRSPFPPDSVLRTSQRGNMPTWHMQNWRRRGYTYRDTNCFIIYTVTCVGFISHSIDTTITWHGCKQYFCCLSQLWKTTFIVDKSINLAKLAKSTKCDVRLTQFKRCETLQKRLK